MPPGLGLCVTVEYSPYPRGLAVVLPGFLDSSEYPATAALAAALPAAGFTSVRLDLRGSWRNARTPPDYLTSAHLKDLRQVIDHVRTAPDRRVVVIGHCYGAFLAALAADADDRITDVVAIMPTRCFIWPQDYTPERDTWRRAGVREFSRPDPATGAAVIFRIPHTAVDDARRHDLPAALAHLRCRILFVAGTDDRVIPMAAVRRLLDECGSPERSLVSVPVQHDYRDHPGQIDLLNRTIIDWLNETELV